MRISSKNSSDSGCVSQNVGVCEQNRCDATPESANGQKSAQSSSTDFLVAPLPTANDAFMGNFDVEAFMVPSGSIDDHYIG